MANALPQAIGVQAAHPDRQVIALSGDGGLAMLLGELLTLRQQRLPVKVVVFNNSALSFVEIEMKADGYVNFGTDLDNPDFAQLARAIGLHGVRVEQPADLDDALRAAFAHSGPAVIDVLTRRQELAIPPTVTFHQAKGFTLWATRSILSGDGKAVLDVATTNLRQLALGAAACHRRAAWYQPDPARQARRRPATGVAQLSGPANQGGGRCRPRAQAMWPRG